MSDDTETIVHGAGVTPPTPEQIAELRAEVDRQEGLYWAHVRITGGTATPHVVKPAALVTLPADTVRALLSAAERLREVEARSAERRARMHAPLREKGPSDG